MDGNRKEDCRVIGGSSGFLKIIPVCEGGSWMVGCTDEEHCQELLDQKNAKISKQIESVKDAAHFVEVIEIDDDESLEEKHAEHVRSMIDGDTLLRNLAFTCRPELFREIIHEAIDRSLDVLEEQGYLSELRGQ